MVAVTHQRQASCLGAHTGSSEASTANRDLLVAMDYNFLPNPAFLFFQYHQQQPIPSTQRPTNFPASKHSSHTKQHTHQTHDQTDNNMCTFTPRHVWTCNCITGGVLLGLCIPAMRRMDASTLDKSDEGAQCNLPPAIIEKGKCPNCAQTGRTKLGPMGNSRTNPLG